MGRGGGALPQASRRRHGRKGPGVKIEGGVRFERLTTVSGDRLVRAIDFRGLFTFPAVIYVQLALNHSIHHRGQLSMLLRPMGAKVPSIYGESYDAQVERERKTS